MNDLPCDCEPSTSFYLTLKPRSFAEVVRDVSKHRDLDPRVFDLLRDMRPKAEVIDMAEVRAVRAKRRPLIRSPWSA